MTDYHSKHQTGLFGSLVAIITFESPAMALECQIMLKNIFKEISQAVERLYAKNDGEASLEDLNAIYHHYGLTNQTGWEQLLHITAEFNEVIWPIPDGMDPAEAEDLVSYLNPLLIEFHDLADDTKPWHLYTLPQLMPIENIEPPLIVRNKKLTLNKKIIH